MKCSPEENSPHDSPPSPSTPFPFRRNHWGIKPPWNDYSSYTEGKEKESELDTPTPSPKSIFKSSFAKSKVFYPDVCEELMKRVHKKQRWNNYVDEENTVVKGRYISYAETGFFWNKSSWHHNRQASADEILKEKLFREFKKNEKKKKSSD